MKLAYVLLLAAGCAGSSTSSSSTAASSGSATTTDTAGGGTTTTGGGATTTAAQTASPAGTYSCFSYTSGPATKRYGCARATECDDYLEQARAVGGLRDISGCASVEAIFCFHQAPSKTDAEGSDVCQPTMEACASERAALVKAGQSADSDCAKR